MNQYYSIGKVAKIKDLTVKALRYYEKVGLLQPAYLEKTTGYRYYTIDQFIHIDIIRECRALGASIKELQEIFRVQDDTILTSFLQKKRSESIEKIKAIETSIAQMDHLQHFFNYSQSAMTHASFNIVSLPERYLFTIPCDQVDTFNELNAYASLHKEKTINHITNTFQNGILYQMCDNYQFKPNAIFSIIDEKDYKKDTPGYMKIDRGLFLTVSYEKDNESASFLELNRIITMNQIQVTQLLELDLLERVFDANSYRSQIQLPISSEINIQL